MDRESVASGIRHVMSIRIRIRMFFHYSIKKYEKWVIAYTLELMWPT